MFQLSLRSKLLFSGLACCFLLSACILLPPGGNLPGPFGNSGGPGEPITSTPSLAPGSSVTPPRPGSIWTQSDLEITADCLALSGDPVGKQLSSSVNASLLALERTKGAPGFNQAAFQVQLDALGMSLSKARAQGLLTSSTGAACIKY